MSEPEPTTEGQHRTRSIAGREILFDAEGFFLDEKDWSEDAAKELALEMRLPGLNEAHWRVIRFLRDYYLNNGKAPLSRELKAGTGLAIMEIEEMFPGGIRQGARVLAGLPNPRNCL